MQSWVDYSLLSISCQAQLSNSGLKEAGKLGFRYAVLPQMQQTNDEDDSAGVTPRPLSDVGALVAEIARAAARLRASG